MDFLRSNFKIDPYKLTFLGDGSNGVAYIENVSVGARVVKITNDENEVLIAKDLQGKNNQYLADIYCVYALYENYHLIIQENWKLFFRRYRRCSVVNAGCDV